MEQQQHPPQQHHMLATAAGRHDTLPPPSTQHTTDLGPPPTLPRLHPNPTAISSPPSYSQASLPVRFPDVPTTELPLPRPRPMYNDAGDQVLPSLSALTAGQSLHGEPNRSQPHWPVLNPIKAYPAQAQNHLPKIDSPDTMEVDASSNSVVSAASPDPIHEPRASSVSLDDPDVRLAAEALGDLRADFVSSPPSSGNGCALLPVSPTTPAHPQSRPEPLLSLLTTSHPLLATTIGSATSAYGGAKNFSPRFKSSAEYVEGYLTPIANTVGSVGRVTGVEGGVRWFLGAGRRGNSSSDLESGGGSKKRRKVNGRNPAVNGAALENGTDDSPSVQSPSIMDTVVLQDSMPPTPRGDRRLSLASTDTLPAYDEMRSPAYTESQSQKNQGSGAAWQSRLIMSTSGLSIAMSDESLRSLKYCLSWLRWANNHIARVIGALKETLEQYDNAANAELQQSEKDGMVIDGQPATPAPGQSRSELAARIDTLKGDVVKTLQDVVNTVSKYAGGALPENARILVRRHLTSLPQRFRVATMSESGAQSSDKDSESAIRDGAHKILVLAKEGLDMVTQVSGVVDGTIVSAEDWCERMGKKRRADKQGHQEQLLPQTEPNGDVKMG
ncbi:Clock-controlled protein 8 [Paramyrothecium foliicola]|nr:Clock-controlled protein 8 [Paramyrothecium foliicola]